MDHGSLSKSRLAAVTFARELHCLNGVYARRNITGQLQDHEFFFCYKSRYITLQKIRHTLRPRVPKFHYIRPYIHVSVHISVRVTLASANNMHIDIRIKYKKYKM